MPLDCLLVADDLSGACDAAVHFAKRGRRTVTLVELESPLPEAEVIAVSTHSRAMQPEDVRRLINDAARRLPFREAHIVFKKIDSTMRGNVGGEIAMAAGAFECDLAIITPAFPAVGRIVEAGYLRLTSGQTFPPIEVARRLRWQGAEPCRHLRPEHLQFDTRFISLDAASDDDLDRIVAAGAASGKRILWAGSGGLAAALARKMRAAPSFPPPPARAEPLFCIGSDQPVTHVQLDRLTTDRPSARLVRVPRDMAPDAARDAVRDARVLVLSGGDTALLVCRAIGGQTIDVLDEILPGIPRGILRGGILDGITVVTKAGGFGGPDALIHVADYFQ